MKTHFLVGGAVLFSLLAATGYAQQPNSRYAARTVPEVQDEEQYVFLTGSNIPRKVKVRRHGTNGADNLSIYDQRDIRASGRATTEGALQTLDPSISVHRH